MGKINEIDYSDTQTKTKQYITGGQVGLATFFGTPLAGFYLLGKNYKTMGKLGSARKCYFYGIVAAVLMVALIILMPRHLLNVFSHGTTIIYTAILYSIFNYLQGKHVKQQIEAGYATFSWVKVLGISVVSLIILLTSCFFAGLMGPVN